MSLARTAGLSRLAGGAGGGGGIACPEQQAGHLGGPFLRLRFGVVDVLQVAEQVRAAPGMQCADEVGVTLVPVADQDAGVAGQDAAGVDRGGGPVPGVHQRQVPGAGHVQVPQAPGGAGRGLVRVQCRRGPQQVPHMVREPAGPDQCGGLAADRGHPPGGHRQAGQLGQQLRGPRDRDVMPADQIRGLRVHLGAVAGAGPHVRRQHRLADDPAARAGLGLRHVLGHLRRRRGRDVGDLVAALCQHWHAGQVRAAAPAGQRGQLDPLIGVIGQAHRGTRVAGLLTRPPLPPLPQRTVSRLLPVRAVRRRRPRRR